MYYMYTYSMDMTQRRHILSVASYPVAAVAIIPGDQGKFQGPGHLELW